MRLVAKLLLSAALLYSAQVFSLANPASVNCVNQGFKLVLIKSTGICIFSDGSYCEEWSYFRNRCKPGHNFFPNGKFDKNRLGQYCVTKEIPKMVRYCR